MKKNELGVIPVYGNIFVTADKLKTNKTEAGIIISDTKQSMNSNHELSCRVQIAHSYIQRRRYSSA